MNRPESDIISILIDEKYVNQRLLAEKSGHSLGIVSKSINSLKKNGYLDEFTQPTLKAVNEAKNNAPKNAIILAAGFGMRMVPINTNVPKGLIEVNGEPLVEHQIKHLHEANIHKIYIVVGFMKEQYEYLIDLYGVELIVNPEYSSKNNLHSLKLAINHLSNTYIIPCDIWCKENPFLRHEMYSWYMVSDLVTNESSVRVTRKKELVYTSKINGGNTMIGIAYLLEKDASIVREQIIKLSTNLQYNDSFWEQALYEHDKMIIPAMVVNSKNFVEINTYEQLRELDNESNHLKSDAIEVIKDVFHATELDITNIKVLKKGMTNRSFLFECRNQCYIMRIPGEGTKNLINRIQEAAVYNEVNGKNISDNIIYINPENGYKIAEYFINTRVCNPLNTNDIKLCMNKLRELHNKKLTVQHEFKLFEQINFYESLWNGRKSMYKDYNETKTNVFSLKAYIEKNVESKVLTHIDAVPDNFLFVSNENNIEDIRLIDWEYAGMQDPHLDIAMFSIYSLYDKQQIDFLIDCYFTEGCPDNIRLKIYCYVAAAGLLWSNWCEYKSSLGIEFGEYSLRQYRYAKEYYRIVNKQLSEGKVR